MKKLFRAAVLMLLCAGLLCGCTKRTIIKRVQDEEDLPVVSEDGIAWEQLWADWTDMYQDKDFYPFAETVNASISPEDNLAEFFLLLSKPISREEAIEYADEVIKGLGHLIAQQTPRYSDPGETSFGSYLDQYDIRVLVTEDSTKADSSTWILEDTVPAGQYRKFGAEQDGQAESQ